jgi:hypothetical protein
MTTEEQLLQEARLESQFSMEEKKRMLIDYFNKLYSIT